MQCALRLRRLVLRNEYSITVGIVCKLFDLIGQRHKGDSVEQRLTDWSIMEMRLNSTDSEEERWKSPENCVTNLWLEGWWVFVWFFKDWNAWFPNALKNENDWMNRLECETGNQLEFQAKFIVNKLIINQNRIRIVKFNRHICYDEALS